MHWKMRIINDCINKMVSTTSYQSNSPNNNNNNNIYYSAQVILHVITITGRKKLFALKKSVIQGSNEVANLSSRFSVIILYNLLLLVVQRSIY